MPVVPNAVERLALLRLNRGPGPLLDLLAAGSFHAVVRAVDLGVFEALAEPRTAADLANDLDADPDTLESFLAFLAAAGYLERDGHRYANTAMTTRWLTDARDTNMAPWLTAWNEVVFPFWEREFERVLREGEPSTDVYTWAAADPDRASTLHAGFRATASLAREDALAAVPVPEGATRLLDVGGGHGLYAAAFAEEYPDLSAVVLDHPAAEPSFEATLADAPGVADRVAFRAADYLGDALDDSVEGEGYDVALLFNVVHAHDAATNRALLERMFEVLRPGGVVAVLDQFTGDGRTPIPRTAVRFVDPTYRLTLGAHTYPAEEVTGWIEEAGFTDARVKRRFSGVTFALGRRP
ncbi:methyltransferase [Salinirubellus sp. GCM10025818]|uniref:methyltransferase n=1 Tax=Salinirubellus TaxID=2162630 RepID=UPI0030D314B7